MNLVNSKGELLASVDLGWSPVSNPEAERMRFGGEGYRGEDDATIPPYSKTPQPTRTNPASSLELKFGEGGGGEGGVLRELGDGSGTLHFTDATTSAINQCDHRITHNLDEYTDIRLYDQRCVDASESYVREFAKDDFRKSTNSVVATLGEGTELKKVRR